ncbi:hypothetical protein Pint_25296 [Pistacia integerrima]|uniref:Uncharacterized protein n=1 Tax=Pistacia integerrima TaxID=434235 RepID=A0ACC0YIJ4_9ROSI|nr:hypothetical protein Pint_25296 [Pistacia integerrima]
MTTAKFPRSFVARNFWINAIRRYSQEINYVQSQSQKDEEIIDACQRVKEAADAFKEGAKVVKKTSKYVKDTVAVTAGSVRTETII